MPTPATSPPREALFTPLGVRQHRSEQWLYLLVDGQVRHYRPPQAYGLGFLLSLYPDAQHWRAMFPTENHGRKIDTAAACAYVAKLCRDAGEYHPPDPDAKPDDTTSGT